MAPAVEPRAPEEDERPTGKPAPGTLPRRPGARDPASGYRRIAWLLILLVLIPSGLLLGVGTILLFRGTQEWNLFLGILILTFVGLLATGSTLVWVFIAKEQGLSQLQTDFVSKVSHELKTPLTSIRLFVETLKLRRTNPEQVEECLELLSKETERLTERIDRLLEWGRMEAGRRNYTLAPDDVGEVVREAIGSFSPLRLQADVELSLSIDADLPKAMVDRPALTAAILNLLSNAYKYGGRPREIGVTVRSSDDRKYILVRVRDNGEGIPPREHKRIFDKFYRRDDRLSRTNEGSGLGLALVKHIARGHRGRVRVESTVGQGTTFTLELRVA